LAKGRFTRWFAHGYQGLFEGAHDPRTGQEPDHSNCLVAHVTHGVGHHGWHQHYLSRREPTLFVSHGNLRRPTKEQQYLFRAVGVGPEPVARLHLE
jgi:hypothetical protein